LLAGEVPDGAEETAPTSPEATKGELACPAIGLEAIRMELEVEG
jgi:hypothetical protein